MVRFLVKGWLMSALATALPASAAMFAIFEQPLYPAAPASVAGVDGWTTFRGTATLTPNPGGVTTVLQGSQSLYVTGTDAFSDRPWGSSVSALTLYHTSVSTLAVIPTQGTFYLISDVAMGSTPAGIEGNADGYFHLFRAGNPNYTQPTAVPFVANHLYRLSMALNIPAWQFTPTVEDLTLGSAPVTIGTYAMFPQSGQQSLVYLQTHGGLGFVETGVYDDIQVNNPEPASLLLLGVAGPLLLMRRGRAR